VKLAQAEAALRSARALLYDILGEAWERTPTGEPASLKQRADLLLATVNATSSAAQVAELMYSNAGTNGIYMKNPLERHCRDLQVLSNMGSPQRAGSRRSVKCTSVSDRSLRRWCSKRPGATSHDLLGKAYTASLFRKGGPGGVA
jgi:Acyl-CoA dehydrogenase, C-terminal domain